MKTFTIVKVNPQTGDSESSSAHQCPECGNIVECQIDGGERHWIHCTCGEVTKCGEGVMERVAVGVSLPRPEPRCRCQDCESEWDEGDLDYIEDLSMRIAPGEPFPAGQCPNCKALCHRIEPEEAEPVAVDASLLEIRDILFRDEDADGNTIYHGVKTLDYRDAIDAIAQVVVEACGDPGKTQQVEAPETAYALADGDLNILTSEAYGHLLPGQVIVGDLEEARAEAEEQSYRDGSTPNIVKITLVEPGD